MSTNSGKDRRDVDVIHPLDASKDMKGLQAEARKVPAFF
jgi:hypothetical protein